MDDFAACYSELAERFKCEAEKEGSIYLPSIRPEGRVDFVLIGMEPSLKRWAKGSDEAMRKNDAREKVKQGFKDFMYSLDDFILHYCVMQYMCSDGLSYYVTNLAKGAMSVNEAKQDPRGRYERWFPLLKRELQLVAKDGTKIIPIGQAVYKFLHGKGFNGLQEPILHYSGRAVRYRHRLVEGYEKEFEQFKASVIRGDIEKTASALIQKADMYTFRASTLERLRHSNLSESRKMLIFGYKQCFERIRSSS